MAQDIIDNYGSYSNYLKNQNQEISNYKEIKELERKNLELDIENKEYQKTIRDQESKIRKLDLRLKRFEFIQKWWWLIGIILIAIGWILSFL